MSELLIPVSPGELLDRISILEIRLSRLTDPDKVSKVHAEVMRLRDVWYESGIGLSHLGNDIARLWFELGECNSVGWNLEDRVRHLESKGETGPSYIEACQAIHRNNDRRSGLKRAINDLVGSEMLEEKLHS